MLQLLLIVFITIGAVCCQNCPIYSRLKNNPALTNEINGTFFKVLATSTLDACQSHTFTIGPNNNIVEIYVQSSNWCLHLANCDSSNPEYHKCDLIPETSAHPSTLPASGERNDIKIVEKIGADKSLCFLYAYCRSGEEGLNLMCRNVPTLIFSLLWTVIQLVASLLNLILPITFLKIVRQYGCTFTDTCPPSL